MQFSIPKEIPVGYVRFYPDIPTEIFVAIGGRPALRKVAAHNLFSSDRSLEFDVCPQNCRVRHVHITKNIRNAFDMHFYDNNSQCLSWAYHVFPAEAAGIFQAETGLVTRHRRKPIIEIDPSVLTRQSLCG